MINPRFVVFALVLAATMPASAASPLYSDPGFTILSDRVIQGDDQAIAYSRDQIRVDRRAGGEYGWTRSHDLGALPDYRSPHRLVDALYRMSLEEMQRNIRPDGAFMAGAEWPGVWTRDISYSMLLSFAMLHPQAAIASLRAKVAGGVIIQDTGTGGSWPISTDRMSWALAAWEVYLVTGDRAWLAEAYAVIRRTADADRLVARDPATGLYHGETSFLDWREQSYPAWMDPRDIYESLALGTNAVHARSLEILGRMAAALGEDPSPYQNLAQSVKAAINQHLWLPDRHFYAAYRYGRAGQTAEPRAETLGEALAILFGVADDDRAAAIVAHMPVGRFGPAAFTPQIPGVAPYHNDSIWPFVTAYWTWAAARTGNEAAVEHGLASIVRAAALNATNQENLVASTGENQGTVINSARQSWSVAGTLAMVHRVLFGMAFSEEGLRFSPFVPATYAGEHRLRDFRYRDAILDISVQGHGRQIAEIRLDGRTVATALLPPTLAGRHKLVIRLAGDRPGGAIDLQPVAVAPATPEVAVSAKTLVWPAVPGAVGYEVFINGEQVAIATKPKYAPPAGWGLREYQVRAVDADGERSFLSAPLRPNARGTLWLQPEGTLENQVAGHSGPGYAMLERAAANSASFAVDIAQAGRYEAVFRYANGNGPINTDNQAAIRTLIVDGERAGAVVLPQRGKDAWTDWGESNAFDLTLTAGRHRFALVWSAEDENMNRETNAALIDALRLTPILP